MFVPTGKDLTTRNVLHNLGLTPLWEEMLSYVWTASLIISLIPFYILVGDGRSVKCVPTNSSTHKIYYFETDEAKTSSGHTEYVNARCGRDETFDELTYTANALIIISTLVVYNSNAWLFSKENVDRIRLFAECRDKFQQLDEEETGVVGIIRRRKLTRITKDLLSINSEKLLSFYIWRSFGLLVISLTIFIALVIEYYNSVNLLDHFPCRLTEFEDIGDGGIATNLFTCTATQVQTLSTCMWYFAILHLIAASFEASGLAEAGGLRRKKNIAKNRRDLSLLVAFSESACAVRSPSFAEFVKNIDNPSE